ncbi:hypothetical protein Ahy_B06g080455 [Arachis hypogaea]|uniref:Uncharacterized protein n=1 Tax=Arachis hypogaea TaxID=3818 RepID=A0A444YI01_ARAHY|nr:hypothetical protein Ahy_B06g080455 [Arachis hypogaea]
MLNTNESGDSNKSKSVVNDDYDDEERMSEVAAMVKEEAFEWEEIISFIINLHIRSTSNSTATNRGFEIWPDHHQPSYYSFGLGPSSERNTTTNPSDDVSVSFSDESNRIGFTVIWSSSSGSSLGSGTNCRDCVNQAKKDCLHLRCRTCCRSRGFQYSTPIQHNQK